jgi:hypothetical protein
VHGSHSDARKKSEDNEMVLSVFGGLCFGCKKKGHKAHECPTKKSTLMTSGGNANVSGRKVGKFHGKCNSCGKLGHKSTDCWSLAENKHKRPG